MSESLAPAYLIVGDDPYLSSEALDQILGDASRLAAEEFVPGSSPAQILEALSTPSIFGDVRAVVVRGLDEMGAQVHGSISSYLEEPSPSVSLILLCARPLPKITAAVRKVGHVIEVAKGKRTDLFGWLREEAKSRGIKASGDAMGALVDAVGEERNALVQALDELAIALAEGARLAPQDVRRHFSGRADARVFAFVDAVAGRQPGPALDSLHRLLRQGEAPQALFWTLARHFRFLIQAGDAPPSRVASELGLPPWRAEKLARQSRNFSSQELLSAFLHLAEADSKMKKSEEPEELTLERAVVQIAVVNPAR